MYDRYQSQALATRLGIPMLYGVDAVHGHGAVKGADDLPPQHRDGLHARSGGRGGRCARHGARDLGHRPGLELRALHRGRARRALGPHLRELRRVARAGESLGAAAIRGFEQATDGTAILATAKHFLADGGTQGGKDQGDAQISEEDLRRIHLPGYAAAVKAGVGSVMVSYSSWNGQYMHGNKHLITDVLKGELGVRRLRRQRLAGDRSDGARRLQRGDRDRDQRRHRHDHGAERVPRLHRALKALVGAGRVTQARIDDAVRRILKQKVRFKLWEKPFTDRALTAEIGSPAHREVARDAVRKSLVVLKNDKQTLPLKKDARVHVCGLRADNMGIQCGGWSVGWRGRRGDNHARHDHPQGDREGRRRGQIDFSENAAGAEKADAVVVGRRRGSLRRGQRRSRQARARRARSGAGRRGEAHRQADRARADQRAAAHPGRRAGRGERGGRGLAAGHRGRRRRRRSLTARTSRLVSFRARGRPTCRRSRSTWATRATRRCSRTGTACPGERSMRRSSSWWR
jgi:beta-glucosidase